MRLLLSVTLGCLLLPVAQAEDALEEMVITATRHAEPLQKYAGSLSQIVTDDIALVGATHHAEVMNRVCVCGAPHLAEFLEDAEHPGPEVDATP